MHGVLQQKRTGSQTGEPSSRGPIHGFGVLRSREA